MAHQHHEDDPSSLTSGDGSLPGLLAKKRKQRLADLETTLPVAEVAVMSSPESARWASTDSWSPVSPLWRLCVEAVADHFGRHSRELLNVSLPARELLLAHLKARFLPPRRHRGACAVSGLSEGMLDWFILPDVRSLDLSHCGTLSRRTMAAIASRCFQLTALDLSHVTSITDADLRPLFPSDYPLSVPSSSTPTLSSSSPSPTPSASPISTATPLATGNSYSFASSSPLAGSPGRNSISGSPSSKFWGRLFSRAPASPSGSSPTTTPSNSPSPAALGSKLVAGLPKPSPPLMSEDGSSAFCLRVLNLRNCSSLTSASVENALRLWGSTLKSLTLDGNRISPSSIAALATATQLTRLVLLHSPPIPVSEMKTSDKAEESTFPVFEWQLAPALQGCLTSAMAELVLHFDSETITEEIVCQVVGQCGGTLKLLEMPLPSPEAWKLVLRHCTSLCKLDLFGSHCNDEAISGMAHFPSVSEISVRGCALSDESFIRIAAACPNTTIFELRSIETVTDAGMEAVAKAIAGNMRNLVIASLENMTDAAFNTFSEYCPNIQTLHIVGMSPYDTTQKLTSGLELAFPSLKELRLSALCVADHTITSILCNCPQIRTLYLDEVGGVTGVGIKSMSIWHLYLRSLPQLNDEGIENVAQHCLALKSVQVKDQPTALQSVLSLLDLPHLLELHVGEAVFLDDVRFCNSGHRCDCDDGGSKEHQSEMDQKLGSDSRNMISTVKRSMEEELMSKCAEEGRATQANEKEDGKSHQKTHEESTTIPDRTNTPISDNVQNTEPGDQKEKKNCQGSAPDTHKPPEMASSDSTEDELSRVVSALRYLKLKNCPRASDTGLGALMQRCPWMTQLRLYYFPQVTGSSLGGPNLRKVVFDQCGLTNKGFLSFIKASPKLREIEINGAGSSGVEITKLSDEGLQEIGQHCSQLRSLTLNSVTHVTLEDVALPQLESLAIEDLPALTDESLRSFVDCNPRLIRLDVHAGYLRLEARGTIETTMHVSKAFLDSLKSSRPALTVTYRLND